MELPRQRSLGGQGANPTHDFLSLYNHPTLQQDPVSPPSQGGGSLRTHDFLQPLEQSEKIHTSEALPALEKSLVVKQPFAAATRTNSVEHTLPGGIGTYSISHISYYNNRARKLENASIFPQARGGSAERNEENSNCSSYSGSRFTLWEEPGSALNRWSSGKDDAVDVNDCVREKASKPAEWTTSERPSLSSNHNRSCLGSASPSYQPSTDARNQGFVQMIRAVKADSQEDDLDEEEIVLKRESSSPMHKGDLSVRVDRKSSDQKANTPRSKHSATEQRRRSKINDRFRMLREIIPQGDQKRDKASFLLEVIEYIQFLQVKVQKYEECYPGWSGDQPKSCSWRNNNIQSDVDLSSSMMNGDPNSALFFADKLDEKNAATRCLGDSDTKHAGIFKQTEQHTNSNKSLLHPLPLQPSLFHFPRRPDRAQQQPGLSCEHENVAIHSMSPPQSYKSPSFVGERGAIDKLKGQDLSIEGGTISISNLYSQGLLNSLTKALQSSGVDLSQASLSVQIDVGKRSRGCQTTAATTLRESTYLNDTGRLKPSAGAETEPLLKKLKTGKN